MEPDMEQQLNDSKLGKEHDKVYLSVCNLTYM